ncbi:MAG TPA: RecQ family ATP-dependent DNA helicase [Glaciibacter sp.]|nr:RecQ family ATP-dependent DNA helicase [Glaciibacter sp.]
MTGTMSAEIRQVAKDRFGWDPLRPGQLEAIEAADSGRDVLAIMPTGYGKSAIYQVTAALQAGPTVVVSPLIALQADQVAGLEAARDAPEAVAVNSAQSKAANERAWEEIATDAAEFVFLAPEQLAKDDVVDRLIASDVSLFVVDEAHSVSAWGHDFRPDYLRLGDVIQRLGHPTVVALTATGSPPVRDEIVERLGMRNPLVLTHGFDRPNLRLEVIRHETDAEKRRAVVDQVVELPRPGLVYVSTRRDATRYAEELAGLGLRAAPYHAGLPVAERRRTHEHFLADSLDVVVATSAFGMGIDKHNVRFVVHAAITESLDAYYQEIGRSGRDGEPATATLHYRSEDLGLRTFFASGAPNHDELAAAFDAIAASHPLRLSELGRSLGISTRRASTLVNLLGEARVVHTARRGVRPAAPITAEEAATRAIEAAESRERIEHSRIAMMRSYAETLRCRRQFLLGYFGEELPQPCGNCDTCSSGSAYEMDAAGVAGDRPDAAGDEEYPPETAVRHREWGPGVVMSTEEDRITVFFEEEGYKVLSLDAIREHDLLAIE